MSTGKSQFVGAAGQFHLAREFALRGINAAITIGNAPSIDLMASSDSAGRTLSFQVKTSRNAYRKNRYGHEGYEWDVNRGVIGKHHESFWYAFVNLRKSGEAFSPEVFFVPSRWVAEFVKPNWGRYMYFLPASIRDLTHERWDLVEDYLEGKNDAMQWANNWPHDRLIKWGEPQNQEESLSSIVTDSVSP
jgi:hypothetical protein